MTIKQRTEREVSKALRLERTARGVAELRQAALAAEREFAPELEAVAPSMRESAHNLVHYLAVRRHDVRQLQDDLARLGLSSLGRMEAHVMASLQAVLEVLDTLRARPGAHELSDQPPVTFDTGDALLAEHANAILGPAPKGRDTRIMVTMPGEAADDPDVIRGLLDAGMGIMRVNCAHDSRRVWERMVKHLRKAERESGRRCLVSFDLAGPKLRTGPMAAGPAVAKWRPVRDVLGRVTQPAHVRLAARPDESDTGEPAIPIVGGILDKARRGDSVVLADTRKRKRLLDVIEVRPGVCLCETDTTAYVVPGTPLVLKRRGRVVARGKIGALPSMEESIALHVGDTLDVAYGEAPGRDAVRDDDGKTLEAPTVSCALAEVFTSVRVGEPMLFDDGKIRGVIRGALADRLRVEITAVAGGAARLKAEKGINLPESQIALPALTARDIEDLAAVAKNADMVALSFVQRPEDIEALIVEMQKLDAQQLGIVLKIETQRAFDGLPMLLLTAMRHPRVAVMVARGDLGVEVGFERLSEVQEEILWLCEAAHVPVVWATQVLESLAKGGMPSRAEVTDAAMGSRAECVMLNKGPYIRQTLRFLIDVLERMSEHQHKKTARLRKLRVSDVNGSKSEHGARSEAPAASSPRGSPRGGVFGTDNSKVPDGRR
ncbi:MAG TPA: pyruvate kinase [Casimicrobiaceae bacterium]|nr:pyruvate kinase [Casimicrobiaceae bacterium]